MWLDLMHKYAEVLDLPLTYLTSHLRRRDDEAAVGLERAEHRHVVSYLG